jgi:hypothetical protein
LTSCFPWKAIMVKLLSWLVGAIATSEIIIACFTRVSATIF